MSRKAVVSLFVITMLLNAAVPSGMAVFSAIRTASTQAFENTGAVNGLLAASSVPVEILNDLITRCNHIDAGYSASSKKTDNDKNTSSLFFLNLFPKIVRLSVNFGICPWYVHGSMSTVYSLFLQMKVFQVHWPPGSSGFIYLMMLSFLVLLARASDIPAIALSARKF